MEKRSRSNQFLRKPSYPKQRASIACEICRSRKSKCDGATPQCGFCKNLGAHCNYVPLSEKHEDKNESATQARLAALEENVQQLNRIVSTLNTDQQLQSPQPWSASPSGSHGAPNNLRSQGIMGNMTANIDFDMTSYLTELESETAVISLSTSTSQSSDLFQARLMTAFFDQIHQWYPIFDQRSFEVEYLLASAEGFISSTRSSLFLMVSAIGALALNLGNGESDDFSDYAAHAFQMLHIVMADHTLIGVQCLILYGIYHLLCFKPIQAYEYLTSASYKTQNLYKRNQGRNVVNTELYRRAFYALYILERELLVQLQLAESGISALEENVSLPSGTFENGNSDDGTILFFLAEIAMQKIMERSDRNLATSVLHHHSEVRFASLVAKEMEFQIVEWRSHLPLSIAFPAMGVCRNDLSLYLQMQYNAHIFGIYWHALNKAIIMKDRSAETASACQKCLLSFCSFIDIASDFFSRPIMLPHISMALASVFTMSLAMTFVRKEEISHEIEQLEDCFSRAVEVLRRYGTLYPAVGHWADVLENKLIS